MEQIVIYKPDGEPYPLQRLFPLTTIRSAVQNCDLLGQDVLEVDFESTEHLEMLLGMKIIFAGRTYTLNVLPEEQKNSRNNFTYKCTFEGVQYDLMACRYFNADASGTFTGSEFSITGNLSMFIDVLINNCKRTFGAGVWQKGQVQDSDVKTISFSNLNCLQALQQNICKEFEVEFEILQSGNVKTINVKKVGQITTEVYEYGMGKGLYTLTRRSVKEATIVNRLYPEGSTENLKPGYRNFSTRLRIGDPGSGLDYIEDLASIAAFGLIEGTKTFDDIKPGRTGVVTGVSSESPAVFFDTTMNFDLNEADGNGTKYLIPGKSAKIHFNTGDLAGYEFEIVEGGYHHDVKSFEIIPITDPMGVKIPGTTEPFTIKEGDEYVILDIAMPDSYVTEAEGKLRTEAQIYLDANKAPLVQYGLVVDPAYLRNKAGSGSVPNFFNIGDIIRIKDTDLGIDKGSRITRFSRNVLDPFVYGTVEIADSYQINIISRLNSEVRKINEIIVLNNLQDPQAQRQSWRSAQEVANIYFDPDGYLKDGKIRAETIETAIALIGVDSGQLQIRDAKFQPNYGGNKNIVFVSAGQIVHLTVEPQIRTWNFNGGSTTITDDGPRYVYAKCNRTGPDASIIFSTLQIKPKEDGSYYHFLIGILNSVDTNTSTQAQTRSLSLTYGFTMIAGEHITTGVIKSADGYTGFDLNTSTIFGNITFRTPEGLNKPVTALENELKGMIADVAEQTDGQVESWFMDGVPTLNNQPAVSWTTVDMKRDHVGDNYFDRISKKTYRFKEENGVFSWEEVSDDRITQAMLLASQAKDTADGKRRIFLTQPVPPYDPGDAWAKDGGFLICHVQRVSGAFNALDWELAEVHDNTVTAINGGLAVTGALYLANEDGTIKAFIRGGGQGDNVILLALGASAENAEFAPLRARRGGALESRSRFEVFNSSNVGVGGINGINSAGDGNIIMWAGSAYAGRASAPWRVDLNGNMVAQKGQIGNMTIQNGGLTNTVNNQFFGDAIIVLRDDANGRFAGIGTNMLPATSGISAVARFENGEIDASILHQKIAAYFSASGGTGPGARNYAMYSKEGICLLTDAVLNGRASYVETISQTITRGVDPSLYDYIEINATAGTVGLGFVTPTLPITKGKEITIFSANDDRSVYLVNVIRGRPTFDIAGGNVCKVIYSDGYWYLSSLVNNDW